MLSNNYCSMQDKEFCTYITVLAMLSDQSIYIIPITLVSVYNCSKAIIESINIILFSMMIFIMHANDSTMLL